MTFLETICQAFNKKGVDYALVGGHAVALHGAVRGTVDIDFVIKWEEKTLLGVEQILQQQGLVSRLPISGSDVFSFRDEYIRNRNLIAWNFYHPHDASQQVDIIISYDLDINDLTVYKTAKTEIALLAKEPLIEMKRKSGRPQDIEDILALEKLAGNLK